MLYVYLISGTHLKMGFWSQKHNCLRAVVRHNKPRKTHLWNLSQLSISTIYNVVGYNFVVLSKSATKFCVENVSRRRQRKTEVFTVVWHSCVVFRKLLWQHRCICYSNKQTTCKAKWYPQNRWLLLWREVFQGVPPFLMLWFVIKRICFLLETMSATERWSFR